MRIICDCGYEGDFADFMRPELDPRDYCCPACGVVFGPRVKGHKKLPAGHGLPELVIPTTEVQIQEPPNLTKRER